MWDNNDGCPRRSVLQSLGAFGAVTTTATGSTVADGEDDDDGTVGPTSHPGEHEDISGPQAIDLAAQREGPEAATITWSEPNDPPLYNPSGVDSYEVFLDGQQVDTVEDESYTFTGLTSGVGYRAGVRAVDNAGNVGTYSTVPIDPITAETFVHDCSGLDALSPASGVDAVRVDTSNGQYFPTPDGTVDEGRLTRSDTTDDVAVAYELPGDVQSLSVQFHKHQHEDGWIDVAESTDGGDSWSSVDATVDSYGGVDGGWIHHVLTADSFSENAHAVKLILTGGAKTWSPQLGRVEIAYLRETIPPEPVEFGRGPPGESGAYELPIHLQDTRWYRGPDDDIDYYDVSLDGEPYAELPAGTDRFVIDDLDPATTYTVGVKAIDVFGNESERVTEEFRTESVLVDRCADLSTTAFGTDVDSVTIDRSNPQYFERFDGQTDGARITRTDTDDADLVYKAPGNTEAVTVEFHRHEEHGGELLFDGEPVADESMPSSVEQYGTTDGGWIHERYTIQGRVPPKAVLTITGGLEAWASQIGHVEFAYEPRDDDVPPRPTDVTAAPLSESAVQLSWEIDVGYEGIYVDGRKIQERSPRNGARRIILTGLSGGTHEIGVSAISTDNHLESEITTVTVDVPEEPVSTFVHDCSDLAPLSIDPYRGNLRIDRSNPSYFKRPDGSSDDGRLTRDRSYDADVEYPAVKPIAAVTAEFHTHTDEGGTVTVSESTDGGDSWSAVDATVETYGEVDAGWDHHQLSAAGFSEDVTHVRFELVGKRDSAPWSTQLGHVELEYE